jgi:ABC-2 type transport system permease protein
VSRILALLTKELVDLRQNPAVFLPAVLTGLTSTALPFFVAVLIPYFTGDRLADSSDFRMAIEMYRDQPGTLSLSPEGAIQAWIFQQFLMLLTIAPIAGAMSIAAAAVITEKQSRTLEPLLATPLTTVELLTAKVLGSLVPALGIAGGCFAFYIGAVWLVAEPGVYRILLTPRSLSVTFLIGPLAALASLQMAVCVSSRVNDARSAQQIGALIILPISGLLVAQLMGGVQLTGRVLVVLVVALAIVNMVLMRIGVALFDRESILTRWK